MRTRLIISIILFIAVSWFFPPLVSAHLGGGPPFLKVNNTYCPTNLTYTGKTALVLPQDYAPDTYLPHTKVNFSIDLLALAIPLNLEDHVTFRWTFYKGTYLSEQIGNQQYGTSISEVFPRQGSYLVKLEATVTGNEPILLDTALVNVIPYKGYKFPIGSVEVHSNTFTPKDPVLFIANATVDKSSKNIQYLWDFGDGKLEKGQSVRKTFTSYDKFLYSRVVDSNGLISDTGISLALLNNTLKFSPIGYLNGSSLVYGKVTEIQSDINGVGSRQIGVALLVVLLVLILFVLSFVFFRKKRRRKRHKE